MAPSLDTRERELTRLYEQLARYQWWMRRWTRARPGERLAMRKRLQPGTEEREGAEDLNPWLWKFANPPANPRVLDLGAGFGDTLLHWAAAHPGSYLGLGLSSFQIKRATHQAARLGVHDHCRFVRQPFDAPLGGPFDLIVAVETLFHAPDLARTLPHVASALARDGVFVLVEDMAQDAAVATSTAGRELLDRWTTPALHTRENYRAGLAAGGLLIDRELDLTDQLILSAPDRREKRRRRLHRLRRCLPMGRQVVDAFLGGLAMEDLQSQGILRYRAVRAIPDQR